LFFPHQPLRRSASGGLGKAGVFKDPADLEPEDTLQGDLVTWAGSTWLGSAALMFFDWVGLSGVLSRTPLGTNMDHDFFFSSWVLRFSRLPIVPHDFRNVLYN